MLPRSLDIREVGPREGFQTHPTVIPLDQKVELIEALASTGVKEIEITSLVRPDRVPQMADADEVIDRIKPVAERYPATHFTALYLNRRGFERAIGNRHLTTRGWIYTAASAEFLKRNNNQTHAGMLAEIPEWLELFARHGRELHGVMVSTAFGCNFEGAISDEQLLTCITTLLDRIRAVGGESLRELSLADTMGWANPEQIRRVVRGCRERFGELRISLHLHDTRGTGLANVYGGLLEGVDLVECSVGGLGGCPFARGAAGNVVSEDVVQLAAQLGIATGVDLSRYVEAAKCAQRVIGHELPGHYYRLVRGLERGDGSD